MEKSFNDIRIGDVKLRSMDMQFVQIILSE